MKHPPMAQGKRKAKQKAKLKGEVQRIEQTQHKGYKAVKTINAKQCNN